VEVSDALSRIKASERTYSDPTEQELNLLRKEADHQTAFIERELKEREYQIAKELHEIGAESLLSLKQKEDLFKEAGVQYGKALEEVEEARRNFKGKDRTSANLQKLQFDYELALRRKDQATEELRMARVRLGRLKVQSPISGTVTIIAIKQGMVVPAGQLLMSVCDLHQLQVRATIDEISAARITTDKAVVINFEGFSDRQWDGHVAWVAPQAVVRDDQTLVEILIRIESSPQPLKVANQVDLDIVVEKKEGVLLLPIAALHQSDSPHVWRCEEGRARKRAIHTGVSSVDSVEVVSGLEEGDRVIVSRDVLLLDGVLVSWD
jgi:macrolide-specific efflux system membrane fusion protein